MKRDPKHDLGPEETARLSGGDDHYRAYVGPPDQYDFMGATQFRLLTSLGLREGHLLLDIGCGSLRAGRLLIPYLLPDRYCGIEPNAWLIEEAFDRELGRDLLRVKRPRFSYRDDFDLSAFGERFDFIVAQSIFSHTGGDLLAQALSKFPAAMHSRTRALVTFKHARIYRRRPLPAGWVYPGVVAFPPAIIDRCIAEAGLHHQVLPWFHPRQVWHLVTLERSMLLTPTERALLHGVVIGDDRFSDLRV